MQAAQGVSQGAELSMQTGRLVMQENQVRVEDTCEGVMLVMAQGI